MSTHRLLFVLFLGCSLVVPANADNWTNWRGPHRNGVAEGDNYAVHWDSTHIKWKVALPGTAGSTPAVWGDYIFVTSPSEVSESANNLVLCFDRQGQQRWRRELGRERVGKHKKGSGSNPSPVTDGRHVFCYFKSGDLVCLNFEGTIVWQRNLQKEFAEDSLWWDLGTSPVLTDQALVVACVQSGPSYLAGFNKQTGEVLWKVDRLLDAPEEANQTYSTPVVVGEGSNQILVMLGADHVTGHDASTGKEVWRVGGMNPDGDKYFRSIASAVLVDDIVVVPYSRGSTLTGIKLGGAGDVSQSHVVWSMKDLSADVPTPASHDGIVYVLTDKGTIAAINGETGEVKWQGSTPKNRHTFSASPILAGGKLYVTREDGTTFVLSTASFEILAENQLDESVVATPVFVDGEIFIRTAGNLYCIAPINEAP